MGNCLVVGEKVIKIMKPDGKILEYRSPIKVYEVLSEFTGHAMSEATTQASGQHLRPETKLRGGQLDYLVPLPLRSPQGGVKKKKKVRFSDPEKGSEQQEQEEEKEKETNKVVRIKLVISKQELQELLSKGGVLVDSTVSRLHNEKRKDGNSDGLISCHQRKGYWKPALESIPEIN